MDQLTLFAYAHQQMDARRRTQSYSLVFVMGTKEDIIVDQKPYGLCRYKKNQIENEPQYKGGTLEIKANY